MQIVIPMSGYGERFRKAGYKKPKPLIVVDGKTIIQHIVEMFPNETDITFICNKDHLNEPEYRMQEILKEIAPESKVFGINPHKLGPVFAVLQVIDQLDLSKPTIVNYADFTCDWNYADFCNMVESSDCDGAIPCYRGFHPHTLWSNYYAYVEEEQLNAYNIQEKQPFTDNPRNEFASSGTYYFKSGELMKNYFDRCVDEKLTVGGEYYVSMVYKPMMEDNLNIRVYKLEHFMQWGVPSDLEEYCYFSNMFNSIITKKPPPSHKGSLLLPMVGSGSRFSDNGYTLPKPLVEVSGLPMATQAMMDLPITDSQRIILRSDMPEVDKLKDAIKIYSTSAEFSILDHMTDGQATTCVEGSNGLVSNDPVTIAACDNGMLYDPDKFLTLMNSNDVDVIVWAARGYPGAIRNPEMYGWIDADKTGTINNVSVKKPLNNPKTDPIVVGAFTFKKLNNFLHSVKKMKERGAKVNDEYYVDTAINDAIDLGLRCVIFEIDSYICWGTPNDLRTFEYWQSCFDSWASHSYSLVKDSNISYKISK